MRQRSSRSLAEFVQLQFWDFNFFWTFWTLKRFKKDVKGFKKQKDDSSMNIHWGIFGCIFLGVLGQSTFCKGLRRDGSCDSGVRTNFRERLWGLQCMEEMEDGGAGYFRSWEDLPRDCLWERFGLDRSFQKRLFGGHWSASDSQAELAAGWVGAFWSTLDEEPYQFPKKLHKSRVHHKHKNHRNQTNQTTQITSNPSSHSHWLLNPFHPIHDIQPFLHWLGWYSVPLLQCKSSRYEAHCMPSHPPLQRYMFAWLQRFGRRGILEVTVAMILLISWIRWQ